MPTPSKLTRELFLSRRNSVRSQIAEALLRRHGGERCEVCSAGLVSSEIDPLARRVMEEIGVELRGHRAKRAREYLGKQSFDYAVSLGNPDEEDCARLFPSAVAFLLWPIDDPADGPLDERARLERATRDRIQACILDWLRQEPWRPPATIAAGEVRARRR